LIVVVLFGATAVLASLKNRAARVLLYASNEDDIDKLLQALGWRKLSHQRLTAI